MTNKEVLKQIAELIELAMEINSKGRESVNIEYSGHNNAVYLTIIAWHNNVAKVICREDCYLNWEPDSSYGTDIMFPVFREKLQELLQERAVC